MITTLKYALNEICHETQEFLSTYRCQMYTVYTFLTLFLISSFTPLFIYQLLLPTQNSELIYNTVQNGYYYVSWGGYWFFLGVLSSIGFGSGLHTGILFLFPWIIEVMYQAEKCGNVNFDLLGYNTFICHNTEESQSEITIWNLFWKCYPTVFLWGVGTAFGEIPPFWISRETYLQNKKNNFDTDITLNKLYSQYPRSKNLLQLINSQIEKRGFLIILLMASYPNALFDMCGMMSGLAGITFCNFLLATIIGKAGIKSSMQLLFVLLMSHKEHQQWMSNLVPESFSWIGDQISSNITIIQDYPETKIGFKQVWLLFTSTLTLMFIISCIRGKANDWKNRMKPKLD